MSKTEIEAMTCARILLLIFFTGLAACRVVHDNPPLPLDAQYHQLPQAVVDRLLKEVPQSPDGREIWCVDDPISDGQYASYCICYTAKSCRDLAASDRCDAKIGEVRPDIGVCRWRIEAVTIG
jgi:hypothetical protein